MSKVSLLVGLIGAIGLAPSVSAQLPEAPPSSIVPQVPSVPSKPPRPDKGPDALTAFVANATLNDAGFEVILGQSRILNLKEDLAVENKTALLAVGDPAVIDFTILGQRQIRIRGRRLGVTDVTIHTADNRAYNIEVRVVADLAVMNAQLRKMFPDASLKLGQIRDHLVVEGQARDTAQVARIMETLHAYLRSVQENQDVFAGTIPGTADKIEDGKAPKDDKNAAASARVQSAAAFQLGRRSGTGGQVINLIRIPGSQQVLLKVRVAELNRTALRAVGCDFLARGGTSAFGTRLGNSSSVVAAKVTEGKLTGLVTNSLPATLVNATAFGIFEETGMTTLLTALKQNNLARVLAEPNLVTMHGQPASFLAGGEFPVPVPQTSTGGAGTSVTVQFKEFGVRLGFCPFIEGDVIRLSVDPEVSSLDFTIGTIIVPGGSPVPGLVSRKAHTVVEMREGQTLAIAGLLQLNIDAQTTKIPCLGDLPVLGTFFSNTTNHRIEKELVVLVTPYLIEPMNHEQVGPSPGDEIKGPTDHEFFLLSRMEGRTGHDHRSTTDYERQHHYLQRFLRLERDHVRGPHGFCD